MRPGPLRAMHRRATSHDSTHGPRTLVSSTRSTKSMGIFTAYWASGMPALLTRIDTGPSTSSALATAATQASASVTSRAMGTHTPPSAWIRSASSCSLSARRAVAATWAPAAASVRAKRQPRPELAPVTMAT